MQSTNCLRSLSISTPSINSTRHARSQRFEGQNYFAKVQSQTDNSYGPCGPGRSTDAPLGELSDNRVASSAAPLPRSSSIFRPDLTYASNPMNGLSQLLPLVRRSVLQARGQAARRRRTDPPRSPCRAPSQAPLQRARSCVRRRRSEDADGAHAGGTFLNTSSMRSARMTRSIQWSSSSTDALLMRLSTAVSRAPKRVRSRRLRVFRTPSQSAS